MPLLNSGAGQKAAQGQAVSSPKVDETVAAGEKKESYWKRSAEKARAEKKAIIGFLEGLGKPLPEEIKTIVDGWKNPQRPGQAFGEPFFNKVFGAEPKVGDKITLSGVFNKTSQGSGKMHSCMKRWAEKGIVVEYIPNETDPRESVYLIKSIAG